MRWQVLAARINFGRRCWPWSRTVRLSKHALIPMACRKKMGLVAGRFQLTSKGFGFVIRITKGDRPDVFIPPRALNGAMNNDRVLARIDNDYPW